MNEKDKNLYAFPKQVRIRRNSEFQYVYRRGKSFDSKSMVLLVVKNRYPSRVGFTCGKKVGNSVERNRAKRLLKESYRLLIPQIVTGRLMVFVGRNRLVHATFEQVQSEMHTLLKKADCLRTE